MLGAGALEAGAAALARPGAPARPRPHPSIPPSALPRRQLIIPPPPPRPLGAGRCPPQRLPGRGPVRSDLTGGPLAAQT